MANALTAPGIAEQWLYSVLGTDSALLALATGGVYSTVAPQGAAYPLLIFAFLGGVDVQEFGPLRTMSRVNYGIKAYASTPSIVALDAIMARVDRLIQGHDPVTLVGGYVLGCQRMTPPQVLGVPDAGINYRQMAAIYRLDVQEGHG